MPEAERRGAIHLRLARMADAAGGLLSTGFASLDRALGGGLPRGKLVEVFGPAGCGKTTLGLQIAAHAQGMGGAAAWIDAERSFEAARALEVGVDLNLLPVLRPDSAEQAFEIMTQLCASGAIDLAVVDSAAALAPALELEAGIGDDAPGLQGRVLASGLRRLERAARPGGAVLLFLNQMRMRTSRPTTAGGASLKLYAGARIEMEPHGALVAFRVLKSKAGAAFAAVEMRRERGRGFAESR